MSQGCPVYTVFSRSKLHQMLTKYLAHIALTTPREENNERFLEI